MPALPDPKILTDNGEYFFKPNHADWHRLVVGTKQHQDFGSGTLTIEQDGQAITYFNGITTKVSKAVFLGRGAMDITLTGATSPDLQILIERIERQT